MSAPEILCPIVIGNDTQDSCNAEVLVSGVTGQEEARRKLAFYVSSNSPNTPFPTLLFTGSQGLGKSYLAKKTAEALNRKFVEINCGSPTIQKAENFIKEVIFDKVLGDVPVTLFLDEAQKLSSEVTTMLLSFLNPNPQHKNRVSSGNFVLEYDFYKINVIFATTDAYAIFKPLRNRCEQVYFSCYSNEELFEIVKMYVGNVTIDQSNWLEIAKACRGRARDAFLLAENIKRLCAVHKTNRITVREWKELTRIFNIYPEGLHSQEVSLLEILAANSPISGYNIAVKMGVNERNVEEDIEIRLKEIGYVKNTPKGRVLTTDGWKYLKKEGMIN